MHDCKGSSAAFCVFVLLYRDNSVQLFATYSFQLFFLNHSLLQLIVDVAVSLPVLGPHRRLGLMLMESALQGGSS